MCREGMLDEALEIFGILEEHHYVPDVDNYNTLILGFCKSQ
ncbi:pentatricopeptide repeat-containing protein, partial [Trifolium medium]|nr:pentatricopeptide repeat-containing protein [Trifolium medium]